MLNYLKKPKILILLVFTALTMAFQSCLPTRERNIREWEKGEWSVVKVDKSDDPSWLIYTRKVRGSNFTEYKIEGFVQSSPHACFDAFREELYEQASDTNNRKYPTYEISEESEEGLLAYVIHNEPFPLKNTEMSVRYLFSFDQRGSVMVKWHEAWEESKMPVSRRLSRVETFRGSWLFTPYGENVCEAINIVSFDPKGMPAWMVRPMVVKFLLKGLKNLRSRTSGGHTEVRT